MFAAPPVVGISKAREKLLDLPPLDADMAGAGETAIASVLYSYGAELDPMWLLALWGLSLTAVTLAELEAKERRERKLAAPKPQPQLPA